MNRLGAKTLGTCRFYLLPLFLTPDKKWLDYAYDTTTPVKGETLSNGAAMRWYMRHLIMVAFDVSCLLRVNETTCCFYLLFFRISRQGLLCGMLVNSWLRGLTFSSPA
jgi:hypothetical protein